ncbi:LY9 isoform 2 [Pongo abelii]|uniref:LY9 isoform 2 n=1 Tax=Pongo abelii TaxID=9601 RepID=A0A2J8VHP4_PONAB|nr:LY9 isoform 2 [Pongo abelii]
MVAPKSHTDDWAPGPFSSKPQRSQLQTFSSVLQTSLLFLLMDPTPGKHLSAAWPGTLLFSR